MQLRLREDPDRPACFYHGHVLRCQACEHTEISYDSCRRVCENYGMKFLPYRAQWRVFEHGGEWSISDAGTYEDALDRMTKGPIPDLVLLDLGLPGLFGLDALRDFREKFPESPCVVLSGQDDTENIHGAIDLSAMGFISKRSSGDAIMDAISLVLKGYVVTPRDSINRPSSTKP